MISWLTRAYKGGKRAGLIERRIVIIDGHKYLEEVLCPYSWWDFPPFFLWHEGFYCGTMQRLTLEGMKL